METGRKSFRQDRVGGRHDALGTTAPAAAGPRRRRGAAIQRAGRVLAACFMLTLGARAQLGFTPPAALNTNAGTDSGNDFSPTLATDGQGNWVAA